MTGVLFVDAKGEPPCLFMSGHHSGLFTHIRLPNQRAVVVEAGRVVEDVATHSLYLKPVTRVALETPLPSAQL